jgi:hypothetical protein
VIEWGQAVDIIDSDRFLIGPKVHLPIQPFIGLWVGALQVKRVFVNQGGEDGSCQLEYEPVDDTHAHILLKQGWREG